MEFFNTGAGEDRTTVAKFFCAAVTFLISFVCSLLIPPKYVRAKVVFFVLTFGSFGFMFSPFLAAVIRENQEIFLAAATTTFLFLALLTPIAFYAKKTTILFLNSLLLGLCLLSLVFILLRSFSGGNGTPILLLCLFLAIDLISVVTRTAAVLNDKKEGKEDLVKHSVLIGIAALELFITLFRLYLALKKQEK
ncbi:MAG: uncharacterized protein A8A55_0956 [Amphiamblys sp. WSBS2006]|nr:MAG: uncharacterized protein A8A55_0956 [Amphiamblys sp. WSBS2006]